MKLKTVTITGASDDTNVHEMAELSREFPYVEWGILFSQGSSGKAPRYPSLAWLSQRFDFPFSVHLCGSLMRSMVRKDGRIIDVVNVLIGDPKRLQLNVAGNLNHVVPVLDYLGAWGDGYEIQIIIQAERLDYPGLRPSREITHDGRAALVYLQDASRGQGITGEIQMPVDNALTGYAGGIGPDNVVTVLDQIQALQPDGGPNTYWIDMESNVRTDDKLDMVKVRRVLELCRPYVEGTP